MKKMMIIALSLFAATAFGKGITEKVSSVLPFKKDKAANFTLIEAKDIKWTAMEGFQGVYISTIEGDAKKGAHHSFIKFDAGFAAPLHTHTANHYSTVIAGTIIMTVDGVEHRLPAGSYFSFLNKRAHATSCAPGADCLLFTDVRGKWDVIPEKESTISSK